MTKQSLFEIKIKNTSKHIYDSAKHQWDSLSKPLDGMGDFEALVCRLAAIQGTVFPDISNRRLVVFCADNGIVAEGISQSGQEITRKVAISLGLGKSTASCLAKSVNTPVLPIDIGIHTTEKIEGVLDRKIAPGTRNFLEAPAMSEAQLLEAIETGIYTVEELAATGVKLIATGEMGIGNTTTSTAVLAALLSIDSDEITGRGAGLDNKSLCHKKKIIKRGLQKYETYFAEAIDPQNRSFEVLRCLGGLDIAALCGLFIGGALYGIPIVIDGLISAAAALLAKCFVPGAENYMLASHRGRERGTEYALTALGLKPVLLGNMALGEGTGALMLLPLLDSALFLYQNGTPFGDNGIENYERFPG